MGETRAALGDLTLPFQAVVVQRENKAAKPLYVCVSLYGMGEVETKLAMGSRENSGKFVNGERLRFVEWMTQLRFFMFGLNAVFELGVLIHKLLLRV